MARFDEALDAMGGNCDPIPRRRRHEFMQEWRQVYPARLHAVTGKWTWHGFEWHVFSYEHARAIHGVKAWFTYASLSAPPLFIICPQDERYSAFEVRDGSLPDFRNSGLDLYVWPDDLEWTMAFTHEEDWHGPFFSRRAWIEE
jgi:hypothetical protein